MTPDQLADIEARAKAAQKEPEYSYVVWARAQDEFQKHAKQDIPDLIAHIRELEEEIQIMSRERQERDEAWAEIESDHNHALAAIREAE